MLGAAIATALSLEGRSLLRLVRRAPKDTGELQWNPDEDGTIHNLQALEGLTAAVHLSGANVSAHRWTDAYKKEITDSRVKSTRILAESLAKLKNPPPVLVVASATGFYGDRGDEILNDHSSQGQGFFPELCAEWEAASQPAEDAGIRVVHLRFGVVIARKGGILSRLVLLFRLGLGGTLGSGKQWMSWVSETDLIATVLFTLNNPEISGAMNTVAPHPVTNAQFTHQLARSLHRPAILPAPAFALRLVFGQMADEALLASTRAVPKRLLDLGFVFEHPTLAEALTAALAKE